MIYNINYNHLYYFWVTAREGGITRAAEVLHLTPQTVSAQISSLETRLDRKLFVKEGRKLKLTDFGVVTKSYADEIFNKANEWLNTAVSGEHDVATVCRVGITDGLPKSLVSKWLAPVKELCGSVQLDCEDGKLEDLLAALSLHKLDLILTDLPLTHDFQLASKCQNIGKSSIGFFALEESADELAKDFPQSLNTSKMVMPGSDSPLTKALEHWFEIQNLSPQVSVYANDIALMKSLGRDGFGVFAAPLVVKEEIIDKYHVKLIGSTKKVQQQYYLITPKRTIEHPVVSAITAEAIALSE